MNGHIFLEIASVLGLAAILGAVGMMLRQPLIVAFLATGIIAGPSALNLIQSYDQIQLLAHIGISLLLFLVGLKLDLRLMRSTGPVALATGMGQVIFTSLFGFIIVYAMGFSIVGSLYVSVALTFSSTIIIVKLLSDKKEIDSLHGRIAVGFLIVQDIVAILSMIVLLAIGSQGGDGISITNIVLIAGKGFGLLACVGILARYVLPGLTKMLAWNQELLVLFAIAWAVMLASTGEYLGFSKEIGAFLGGVSLASTQYREAIGARLVGLRDFLLLFFFIDLGARLDLVSIGHQISNSIYLSLFVLIGNPLVVMAIMGFMGYRRRTGFMAGLTVAQISEFSLILGALGLSLGHIDAGAMSIITLVGVITICMSTYMIVYSGTLYRWLASPLKLFERKHPYREEETTGVCLVPEVDVLLIGLGNYGSGLAEHLLERKKRIAGVDFNPMALQAWRSRGIPVIFGDVGDPEFLDNLPLDCSAWVVSTVRERELNLTLLHLLKERRYDGKIALAAKDEEEAKDYSARGSHVVLRPFDDASEEAADSLTGAMHLLPEDIDWPLGLREIRIRKGSVFAGQRIGDLNLRAETGISIMAVSRAGRVFLETDPDFRLFPGDRIIAMGEPDALRRAEDMLQQVEDHDTQTLPKRFAMAEVLVGPSSPNLSKSFADIRFRKRYGATVIGIIRGEIRIPMPKPDERLQSGDRLIVLGAPAPIEAIKEMSPL